MEIDSSGSSSKMKPCAVIGPDIHTLWCIATYACVPRHFLFGIRHTCLVLLNGEKQSHNEYHRQNNYFKLCRKHHIWNYSNYSDLYRKHHNWNYSNNFSKHPIYKGRPVDTVLGVQHCSPHFNLPDYMHLQKGKYCCIFGKNLEQSGKSFQLKLSLEC